MKEKKVFERQKTRRKKKEGEMNLSFWEYKYNWLSS